MAVGNVREFLEKARQQLDDLFGKDIRGIKVYLSEELARDMTETMSYEVEVEEETKSMTIAMPKEDGVPVVRGWMLATNSPSGKIILKFVPSDIIIAELIPEAVKMLGMDDVYIAGYPTDSLVLQWYYVTLYAKIFAQITGLNMYSTWIPYVPPPPPPYVPPSPFPEWPYIYIDKQFLLSHQIGTPDVTLLPPTVSYQIGTPDRVISLVLTYYLAEYLSG